MFTQFIPTDLNDTLLQQQQRIQELEETVRLQNLTQQDMLNQLGELQHALQEQKNDNNPTNTTHSRKRLRVTITDVDIDVINLTPKDSNKSVTRDNKKRKRHEIRKKFRKKEKNKNLPQLLADSQIFENMPPEAKVESHNTISIAAIDTVQPQYDQATILKKINAFAAKIHAKPISEAGHCHGITLLWLYTMRHRVENVFYGLLKKIAECPDDELLQIQDLLITFYKLIEVGQNPKKYFGDAYSQRNIETILDAEDKDSIAKELTPQQLDMELLQFIKPDQMISITGWGSKTNPTTNQREAAGHTIGVIYRDGLYHMRDPNFNFLGAKTCTRIDTLANNIFSCVFDDTGIESNATPSFNIDRVSGRDIDPSLLAKLSFFSKQVPAPVVNESCDIDDGVNDAFAHVFG
jgi:hypothetical protein